MASSHAVAGGPSAGAARRAGAAASPKRRTAKLVPFLLGSAPVAVTAVFVGVPVLLALLYTLGDTGGLNASVAATATHQVVDAHGLTIGAYRAFFASPQLRADLVDTVEITVSSTAILTVAAWVLALYVRFSTGRLARAASSLYVVPMFIPVVIASFALVTFWQGNGKLSAILHSLGLGDPPMPGFTAGGIVIGQVWTNLPFAVIVVSSGLSSVPDALVEAARDAGVPWWRIVTSVLAPLNKLPTAIVVTFSATGILGSYTIPDLMGPNAPQMLGVAMTNYYQSYGQPQQAEVMAVIVFAGALVLSVFYIAVNRSSTRAERAQQVPAASGLAPETVNQ